MLSDNAGFIFSCLMYTPKHACMPTCQFKSVEVKSGSDGWVRLGRFSCLSLPSCFFDLDLDLDLDSCTHVFPVFFRKEGLKGDSD